MARILFWNINNFSLTKINDPANPLMAQARQSYMRWVFETHPPDIIVIAEVTATGAASILDGIILAGGNGITGVLTLLADMRARMGPTWCLVPPLTLGDEGFRELVAVFFNSATLEFTGPWIWTNHELPPPALGLSRSVAPGGPSVRGNYPPPWFNGAGAPANTLPAALVNAMSPNNPAVPQNQCAAQYRFFNLAGGELFFPTGRRGVPGPPLHRAPFLTTFYDVANDKTINLYSVHTSPNTARQAVRNMADINGIVPLANALTVIAGDFNLDTLDDANHGGGGYGPLVNNHNFELRIDPGFGAGGAILPTIRPFCMTHLLPDNAALPTLDARATPYNNSTPLAKRPSQVDHLPLGAGPTSPGGFYPCYGVMGAMGGPAFQQVTYKAAIDNFLIQYGGGTAVVPGAHNTTIINPIPGSPYTLANPGNFPAGHYNYPSRLSNPLPVAGIARANDHGQAILTQFLQWNNYGVIHSTSDHLPIITDV